MRRKTMRTPRTRSPIIEIDGQLYIDLLFAHDQALEVDLANLQRFLTKVPSETILLARRLSQKEASWAAKDLRDLAADVHARLILARTRWKEPK